MKVRGSFLVVALILLQCIAMLFLEVLRHNLEWKYEWEREHRMLARAHAMRQIMKNLASHKNIGELPCQIHFVAPNRLKLQPLPWWQAKGCAYAKNDQTYYVVLERIHDHPCVTMGGKEALNLQYYRATIYYDPSLVQQAMLAISFNASNCEPPYAERIAGIAWMRRI